MVPSRVHFGSTPPKAVGSPQVADLLSQRDFRDAASSLVKRFLRGTLDALHPNDAIALMRQGNAAFEAAYAHLPLVPKKGVAHRPFKEWLKNMVEAEMNARVPSSEQGMKAMLRQAKIMLTPVSGDSMALSLNPALENVSERLLKTPAFSKALQSTLRQIEQIVPKVQHRLQQQIQHLPGMAAQMPFGVLRGGSLPQQLSERSVEMALMAMKPQEVKAVLLDHGHHFLETFFEHLKPEEFREIKKLAVSSMRLPPVVHSVVAGYVERFLHPEQALAMTQDVLSTVIHNTWQTLPQEKWIQVIQSGMQDSLNGLNGESASKLLSGLLKALAKA
jgi:hypothetical protein